MNNKVTKNWLLTTLQLRPLPIPTPVSSTLGSKKQSAVAVTLFHRGKTPYVLLTQRQFHMRSHAGQFSLPGGKFDQAHDLNLIDTALRESEEEVGIEPQQQTVVSKLNTIKTLSGFEIHPYVTYLDSPPQTWRINPSEVHKILELPLTELLYRLRFHTYQHPSVSTHSIYFINYQQQIIWGATGAILRELRQLLLD